MDKIEYYNQFEAKIAQTLYKICKDKDFMGDHLLESEDIISKWQDLAPEYMVNAVPEFNKYPMVAIAWAAYLGMGMAAVWDKDWEEYSKVENLYKIFVEPKGFDNMDEYIMEEMYGSGKDSEEFKSILSLYQELAETALTYLRKENIEPQSVDAFQIYARTEKIFYKIGISIGLKLLGYKYEKVDLPQA